MAADVSSWVGAAVTASIATVAGSYAILRRIFVSVTREEFLGELEKKHQENRDATHALRDSMNASLLSVRKEIAKVGQELAYLRGRLEAAAEAEESDE